MDIVEVLLALSARHRGARQGALQLVFGLDQSIEEGAAARSGRGPAAVAKAPAKARRKISENGVVAAKTAATVATPALAMALRALRRPPPS